MNASDPAALLLAYDDQLRTDAEVGRARTVTRLGPLYLAAFPSGRGFVTYRDLGDSPDEEALAGLARGAVEHFRADPRVTKVEWKTRGHDRAPGLDRVLAEQGFVAGETESIMVGAAHLLAVDVDLPTGVTLRQVTEEATVRAACALQDRVFTGRDQADAGSAVADEVLASLGDGVQLWVAEASGVVVCAGRLEPVPGTEFAGVWGGATLPQWRGRGIYRALTAARAGSALALGKRFIHSDSTAYSRPILERSGLVKVSTTTPFDWSR
ncbi:MAG: GNAT family N-acetyltransferase [Propionibacteriaceae bacterium]